MKHRMFVLSILMILLIPEMTQAQYYDPQKMPRTGKWSFGLQTRYTTSSDFEGEGGSELSLRDSMGWGFGFDYHLHKNFELGMAFSWRSIGYNARIVDGDDPSSTSDYASTLSISTAALNGAWNILDGPFTPYVNGSIGWTIIDTNIIAGVGTGCWWDPWYGYVCGSYPTTYGRNTSTASLGLGGRFQVTGSFFLRAGYEYDWIGEGNVDGSNMLRIDFGFLMN